MIDRPQLQVKPILKKDPRFWDYICWPLDIGTRTFNTLRRCGIVYREDIPKLKEKVNSGEMANLCGEATYDEILEALDYYEIETFLGIER